MKAPDNPTREVPEDRKVKQKMVWRKMMCDNGVCEGWYGERWCVTDLYVKDSVWQRKVVYVKER